MNQRMSVVILLIGLYPDQKIMCYVLPLLLSQSFLITSVSFVSPDPAVSRESGDIRAINRAAFRDDLCMLVSPELCPSIDDFNSTLQSLLEKHAPLRRRRVRADRLEPRYRDVRTKLKLLRSGSAGLKDSGSKRQRQ